MELCVQSSEPQLWEHSQAFSVPVSDKRNGVTLLTNALYLSFLVCLRHQSPPSLRLNQWKDSLWDTGGVILSTISSWLERQRFVCVLVYHHHVRPWTTRLDCETDRPKGPAEVDRLVGLSGWWVSSRRTCWLRQKRGTHTTSPHLFPWSDLSLAVRKFVHNIPQQPIIRFRGSTHASNKSFVCL